MKNQIKWLFLFSVLLVGCEKELEQYPMDTTSRHAVFNSETGLKLYTNSFYEILPSANNIHTADCMSDYGARRDVPRLLLPGGYDANSSDNTSASARDVVALGADADWEWEELRNVNYYIVNANDPAIPDETQRHYLGVAKFFRAFLYFEKVKRYGDVPWFGKPIDVEDQDLLYGTRDPRTLVMDSVLADINYACENIKMTSDNSRSMITKWVAYAFKSRICLYEGTFRKYHTELGLQNTADDWLNECVAAAEVVINESGFKLYTTAGTDMSYRLVFTQNAPVGDEVMLTVIMNERLGETHSANWYYTSGTTGVRWNFIRTFINTYLMLDGTPFTDTPGYETMEFKEEMKSRDKRLKQTIRAEDYNRIAAGALVATPPDFGYTYTGYQPIKWCLDDVQIDTRDLNTNSVCIFRFGEVLLNYAEAKAELGTLTDADWAMTVGALRARAGITGGLEARPTTVDSYLQSNYFPEISDPVLLEIRRERGIELCFEGFRFYDIVRWKKGELMEMEWNGMYVPGIDTYLYLNEDTIPDVYFYKVKPSPLTPGVDYIDVSASSELKLKNDTYGEITWLNSVNRVWAQKNYYYPIPEEHIIVNPNISQNSGW